jgi:cob(I)alamin adenosyltransferase
LYTRRGDRGETSLYGPARVSKDSPRVEAYGTVDELNSYLGVVISHCQPSSTSIAGPLKKIQSLLFVAGADLATEARTKGAPIPRITKEDVRLVERMTDDLLSRLPTLTQFILPGGSALSAEIHFARSVCRRAERRIVTLAKAEAINSELTPFFNRLSSYLFNLARYANSIKHRKDEPWNARATPG